LRGRALFNSVKAMNIGMTTRINKLNSICSALCLCFEVIFSSLATQRPPASGWL
jgi:hypothetical protein